MTKSKMIHETEREALTDLPDMDHVILLRRGAAEAGDQTQVEICDAALAGDEEARAECARVIAAAAAQE